MEKPAPKPIEDIDVREVIGIFFDIDDTFSSEGKITKEAYSALWNLKNIGKIVVPITGRPAGWCDHIARMWPVNAVVGENGAFYQMMRNGRMVKKYAAPEKEIETMRSRLFVIRDEVMRKIKGSAVSSDQAFREFDLSIDYCEDVPRLSEAEVDRIVEIFERHGATTKVSSVHVNGWFGDHTKLTTAKLFVQNELCLDIEKDNHKFVFAGDSQNDEPMFEFFEKSVGVANVMDFAKRLKFMPKYITRGKSGAGFAELAKIICG